MTIFMVETYTVKPDKLGMFPAFIKKAATWMKKHPEMFKEVKSYKIFGHMLGGNTGGYVEMTEFENLVDFEKWFNKIIKSEFMATLYPEFTSFVVAGSDSMGIWNSVPF